jgi:hypothetical protein
MERNLCQVVDAILKKVPEDYPHKKEIGVRLEHVKKEYKYVAPELRSGIWDMTANVLSNTIPYPPEEPWQQEIADIFGDKIDVGAERF